MTKKKPGAVRGRPKGSGRGLQIQIGVKLTPELVHLLDVTAKRRRSKRSEVARKILERWAARKLRRERRRFLALLQARMASRAGSDRKPVPSRER
jgi:hypothetical protein